MILLFWGEGNGKGFYHANNLLFFHVGGQII